MMLESLWAWWVREEECSKMSESTLDWVLERQGQGQGQGHYLPLLRSNSSGKLRVLDPQSN